MARPHLLLHVLLCLLAAALLVAPTLSLADRSPDGGFSGWKVTDVATHPTNHTTYIVDYNTWIRTLDGLTGRILPPVATVGVAPWSVECIAVNGVSGHVYALAVSSWWNANRSYALLTFTADLKLVANVSMNATITPPLLAADTIYPTLLVDEKGLLYISRRLPNSTMLVHILQNGKQVNVWRPPFATRAFQDFQLAIGPGPLLYFQSYTGTGNPTPLYITTTAGNLTATLTLRSPAVWEYDLEHGALAITHSGNIAISFGNSLFLFNGSGYWLRSFFITREVILTLGLAGWWWMLVGE